MLEVSPTFNAVFNKVFEENYQKEIAYSCFEEKRQESISEKDQRNILSRVSEMFEGGGKKYFETNRQFNQLVPTNYHRTNAPRISAKGSTFHGMKKSLL